MTIVEIISKYGVVVYALCILFGGKFGLQYFSYFKKTKYNFLIFATVVAIGFIVMEKVIGTFKVEDFARYFLTYAVVTTCYEQVSDWLPFLKPKKKDDETIN